MTPQELRDIGEKLYGDWGWQTRMAETLKVDSSTVRRWLSGKVVIPGPVEVALGLLLKTQTTEDRNQNE
jgi:hypothetical protein